MSRVQESNEAHLILKDFSVTGFDDTYTYGGVTPPNTQQFSMLNLFGRAAHGFHWTSVFVTHGRHGSNLRGIHILVSSSIVEWSRRLASRWVKRQWW